MSFSAATSRRAVNPSAVKIVICLGAFLSNLSAGMFNIALVDISADLRIPVASAQWVVSIYLLVISVLLPVMGRLGDKLGRRRVHNFGLFAFAAGALGCALAPNAVLLLGFRVIQGVGASMYQATNMALIVSVFPAEHRGRALGLMSTFVAAGSMAGPGLGGFLIQWFSWESNFWLLAAVAGGVALLAERLIPQDTETAGGRLDLGGAVWFAACLSPLMIALDLGGRSSFLSLPVLLLFAASAGAAAGFAAHARSSRRGNGDAAAEPAADAETYAAAGTGAAVKSHEAAVTAAAAETYEAVVPATAVKSHEAAVTAMAAETYEAAVTATAAETYEATDKAAAVKSHEAAVTAAAAESYEATDRAAAVGSPEATASSRTRGPADSGFGLFADRNFAAGIAITVITYMAAFAAQLALPSLLRLAGAEPALVGLIMIGYPLALVVTAPISGSFADRKGPHGILTAGLLLMSVTLLSLGFAAPALGTGAMILPVVLLGCSMGMVTSPNTSIVMGLAKKSQLGRVSSVLALSRNIGMMFGTAAGGLVIGGGTSGSGGGTYMAVFLVCAAGVGLSSAWLLYSLRRSNKEKGVKRLPWTTR